MAESIDHGKSVSPLRWFPPTVWLRDYRFSYLPSDFIAGITLAAYAIPVSLAYAGLAGLPPQVGVYGYPLGGFGYALLGSSRQLRPSGPRRAHYRSHSCGLASARRTGAPMERR